MNCPSPQQDENLNLTFFTDENLHFYRIYHSFSQYFTSLGSPEDCVDHQNRLEKMVFLFSSPVWWNDLRPLVFEYSVAATLTAFSVVFCGRCVSSVIHQFSTFAALMSLREQPIGGMWRTANVSIAEVLFMTLLCCQVRLGACLGLWTGLQLWSRLSWLLILWCLAQACGWVVDSRVKVWCIRPKYLFTSVLCSQVLEVFAMICVQTCK